MTISKEEVEVLKSKVQNLQQEIDELKLKLNPHPKLYSLNYTLTQNDYDEYMNVTKNYPLVGVKLTFVSSLGKIYETETDINGKASFKLPADIYSYYYNGTYNVGNVMAINDYTATVYAERNDYFP